eukprot:10056682-Alexandrium_andersonii.AAC.1
MQTQTSAHRKILRKPGSLHLYVGRSAIMRMHNRMRRLCKRSANAHAVGRSDQPQASAHKHTCRRRQAIACAKLTLAVRRVSFVVCRVSCVTCRYRMWR